MLQETRLTAGEIHVGPLGALSNTCQRRLPRRPLTQSHNWNMNGQRLSFHFWRNAASAILPQGTWAGLGGTGVPSEELEQLEVLVLGQATPLHAGPQFSCLRLRKLRLQKPPFSDTFGRPATTFLSLQ